MSKYRNRKAVKDGIVFDSVREMRRYAELSLLEKAGDIKNLRMQVVYELLPVQREPDTIGKRGGVKKGKVIENAVKYVADFVYEQDGETVVEDSKGFHTKDYIIKRKLMLWRYGIRIKEV